ncbi:hypothetical protein TCAL_15666, partial [Tigriopus californicus]
YQNVAPSSTFDNFYGSSGEDLFLRRSPKLTSRILKDSRKICHGWLEACQPRIELCSLEYSKPMECEQKGLLQTYQKILLLPRPDYPQRHELWREIIISKGGDIESQWERFDLSALAKIIRWLHYWADCGTPLTPGGTPTSTVGIHSHPGQDGSHVIEKRAAYETWFAKTPLGK